MRAQPFLLPTVAALVAVGLCSGAVAGADSAAAVVPRGVSASATPTPGPTATPTPTPTPTPPTPVVAAPHTVSLSRTWGHASAQTAVTLQGTHLENVEAVTVGGIAAAALVHLSDHRIRFTVPAAPTFQAGTAVVGFDVIDGTVEATRLRWQYRVTSEVDREMRYAGTHWDLMTSARWGYYPGVDCVNFVSQLLHARGWKQSSTWYDDGQYRTSLSWINSNAFSTWLHRHPESATRLRYRDRAEAAVGDVIQFNWNFTKQHPGWDHTAVISQIVTTPTGDVDLYYTAHTNARLHGGGVIEIRHHYGAKLRIQIWHLLR